jgi:hypothetical protein
MRNSQDAKSLSLDQIDNLFSRQKAEEKRVAEEKKKFNALPTLEFHFTIMSDDRDLLEEDSEDPHQKYSQRGYGKTQELAEKDAKARFHSEWGSDLEIYWIKCHGFEPSLNSMSAIGR